jgi:hypothetical protein
VKFAFALVLSLSFGTVLAQPRGYVFREYGVGLRDGIGIGISGGSMTAVRAECNVLTFRSSALRLEGAFGAGVAKWGISEAWTAGIGGVATMSSDYQNDALLWTPGISFNTMIADRTARQQWFDFSPYETIHAVEAHIGIGWVHEFSGWSIESSVRPGVALGLDGRDSGNNSVEDGYTFQLFVAILARF